MQKNFFTVVTAFFVTLASFQCFAESGYPDRSWSTADGKNQYKAAFVQQKGNQVILQRSDNGETVSIALTNFSEQDQAYVEAVTQTPPITVKVLVLCYNPTIPSEGNRKLWQVFNWNEPRKLAELNRSELEKYSHNRVRIEFVDWVDIDDMPPRTDKETYTREQYVQNRRTGTGWYKTDGTMDYYQVMLQHRVPERINSGEIDEVWCLGDHFFGTWEASMMGPKAFFINGGVYPKIDTDVPFAVMGGNYERNVDCMLENLLHRTENHISRAYGGWNIKAPKTTWDRFTANIEQSPLTPAVGSCHYAPNSKSDYDWGNKRYVDSTAEDWFNYPNLTGKTTRINCEAWQDIGWHQWWLMHLPKAPGVNPDGRQNNWWKYIYDYNNYEPNTGTPKPIRAICNGDRLRFDPQEKRLLLHVAYLSPEFINTATVKEGRLYTDWDGTRTEVTLLKTSDPGNCNRIVAEYAIALPDNPAFKGKMSLRIEENQIADLAREFIPAGELAVIDLDLENNKVFRNSSEIQNR